MIRVSSNPGKSGSQRVLNEKLVKWYRLQFTINSGNFLNYIFASKYIREKKGKVRGNVGKKLVMVAGNHV